MPRGKPWPIDLVIAIAQNMMEKEGWTKDQFNTLSPDAQMRMAAKYARKAKDGLHACLVLGLIEFKESE